MQCHLAPRNYTDVQPVTNQLNLHFENAICNVANAFRLKSKTNSSNEQFRFGFHGLFPLLINIHAKMGTGEKSPDNRGRNNRRSTVLTYVLDGSVILIFALPMVQSDSQQCRVEGKCHLACHQSYLQHTNINGRVTF